MNATRTQRAKAIAAYNRRIEKQQAKDESTPLPSLLNLVADWSFVDLARATGLHKAAISNILAGKRIPNLLSAVKISRAIGVDLEKFAMSVLQLHADRHRIPQSELGLPEKEIKQ